MTCVVFLLAALWATNSNGQILPSPVIETNSGPVRGQTLSLHSGQQVHSFWAIPFAAPPLGQLRFEKPAAVEPWEEVFVADTLGSACPQTSSLLAMTHPQWTDYDEDCLHLNVFTPEIEDPENPGSYPVMVWFHGGAYTGSANVQYPGHFLAALGVVVVVPNYRIGHLGFVTTSDSVAPGNYGLWDQHFALEWVKDNIANFGGDNMRVTLFGQSAGASSSSLHMVSPHSRGLFDAVIAESGSDVAFWAINWPEQDPADYTRQVAAAHDCPTVDSQEMIDCLREVPWELLYNTSFECTEGHFCQGMAPVIDGEGGFLPENPLDVREDDAYNHVPLISGFCTEDGSLYTAALIPGATEGGFNRTEFERLLQEYLLDIWSPQFTPEQNDQIFDACNWYYSPWPHIDDEEANRQAFNYLITDGAFGMNCDSQLKSQSKQVQDDVFSYVFGFRSTNASVTVPEWMGVPHNGELPYVWGYPLLRYNLDVRVDSGIFFDLIPWNDLDSEYADWWEIMWTNFAKVFNPTPEPVQAPTGEYISWTPFEAWNVQDMNVNYLYLDNDMAGMIEDYRQRDYAFFTEYVANIANKRIRPEDTPGWPDEEDLLKMRKKRSVEANMRVEPHMRINSKTMEDAVNNVIDDMIDSKFKDDAELYDITD